MTLKELRIREGLSRKDLADRIGVAVPTICRYENGTRKIPVAVAMEIGKIFSVPWPELYSPDGEQLKQKKKTRLV